MIEISPVASVKLDGSGNGQVSIGPPSGTVWRLRLANVSTTGTVKQPQVFLYRGSTSGPLEQIDSSYLGNSASSGKVAGAPFFQGQVLWAKWVGGDASAVATLQAYGQQGGRGEVPFDVAVGEGFPLSVATAFQAGNTTVINASGLFVYSGAPATGNLIGSLAPASGTDPYSNSYLAGFTSYNSGYAAQMTAGQIYFMASLTQTYPGYVYSFISNPGELIIDSGAAGTTPNLNGQIRVSSSDCTDVGKQFATSEIDLYATNVYSNGSFSLSAGNGPFVKGETWHDVGNGVGGVVARVKLLPWNAVWLDVEATEGATGTFTLASLPSASYYPTQARHFPLATTAGSNGRISVGTSGAIQLIVGGSGAWNGGASVIYPNN